MIINCFINKKFKFLVVLFFMKIYIELDWIFYLKGYIYSLIKWFGILFLVYLKRLIDIIK